MRTPRAGNARTVLWAALRSSLVAIVLLLAIATKIAPWAMGGSSLVVLTGSMEPTLRPGDVIAVRPVSPSEVRIGDIVTFQPVSDDPALITHRVVSKGYGPHGLQFVTKGDNNNAADEPIVAAQVKGLFVYRVPWLGYGFNAVGGVGGPVVGVLAAALLGYAVYAAFLPPRSRRGRRLLLEPSEADAGADEPSEDAEIAGKV